MEKILFKIAELTQDVHELPNSRERACLLTKLDEARHWARDMKDRGVVPAQAAEGTAIVQS